MSRLSSHMTHTAVLHCQCREAKSASDCWPTRREVWQRPGAWLQVGLQSRLSESARAGRSVAGVSDPCRQLSHELARVFDSVGKWPAWRGLDAAALPSHFVTVAKVSFLCASPALRPRQAAGACRGTSRYRGLVGPTRCCDKCFQVSPSQIHWRPSKKINKN